MAGRTPSRRVVLSVYTWLAPIVVLLVLIPFSGTPLGKSLDFLFRDFLFQLRHANETKADPRILFVGIDDATIAAVNQRWPFNRAIHGQVLSWLDSEEPGVVGWDVIFSESAPDQDPVFIEGVKSLRAPAVFASSVARAGGGEDLSSFSDKRRGVTRPLTNVKGDISQIPSLARGMLPIEGLTEHARFGFIHDKRDSDGVKRRSFLLHRIDGRVYPNLPLQMLLAYHDVPSEDVEVVVGEAIRIRHEGFERDIPINEGGEFDVNYRYTIKDVSNCSYVYLENQRPLKDRILLIAQMSTGLTDMGPSPLEEYAPFAMMHVNTLANILDSDYVTVVHGQGSWVLWLGWLLITVGTLWWFSRFPYGLAIICPLLVAGVYFGCVYALFQRESVVVPYVFQMLGFVGLHVGAVTRRVLDEQREKQRIRDWFSPYVTSGVADQIMEASENPLELGGVRRNATVLFSDIRAFTRLSERTDEEALVLQLNEYFTEMVDCVNRYDGSLHKFIGDAIMAVWGDYISQGEEEDAWRAVQAGLDMHRSLKALNDDWERRGMPTLEIGVGINHGELIAGHIGAPQRKEFTVIGDPVNLASRLEGLTKPFGVGVIVGPQVRSLVEARTICRTLGLIRVVGRHEPVEVTEILGRADDPALAELRDWAGIYEQGFVAYRERRFEDAVRHFELAVQARPDDYLTDYYLTDASDFVLSPPPDDWTCLYTVQSK